MDAENRKENYLQKNNAKHEGYERAHRSFNWIRKERNSIQSELLEKIPDKDNLIITFNGKGAPGITDMAIAHLMENQKEFGNRIYREEYIPSLVRRVEIPKLDDIPTVIDQTLQQAITQQLMPIYEPLFAEGSYGYRPGRNAKRVKEYEEQGYTFAVSLDLSQHFYTLNHERLLNLSRQKFKNERVIQLIKRYLKSGVMENGVAIETPQRGNLSLLLANIYLDKFDKEYLRIGVPYVRYADDIVLLAKSKRTSERLLESSTRYLEEKLKLALNREKSRTVNVFAIRNFKFLGFTLGRNGGGVFIKIHPKSWKKFIQKLKILSSRRRVQSIKPSLEKIRVYARGWLNYYGIASMKNRIEDMNGWLYRRIRMCIWKQCKKPKAKRKNLMRMGIPEYYAHMAANSYRGHWFNSNLTTVKRAMTKERLIKSGFYDLATAYQSVHINY